MLVSILANLVMGGGVIPPEPPQPFIPGGAGGGGGRHEEEKILKDKQVLQDNENLALVLSWWLINQNKN